MAASTKPYTLQSPEQIAKDYGGNKQKIAEAMQMGVVDPTAGTIAGMFIDRIRAAAQTEQTPQQTVAQQVFAPPAPPTGGIGMPAPQGAPPQGAPPQGAPPQGAPPAPPAGLGGTPEAAQMQAAMPEMGAPQMPMPEMAPPEMPQEEAPMGMAEGGIAALPIPDTMFDEPDNGGYDDTFANGGIVAFARGGYNDFHNAIITQESGGRYGVANAQGSGAMGIGQLMPDTARAIAKRLGLAYKPDLLAGTDEASRKYQDTLSREATKEAFNYAKGNPQLAAQYYFAGPDKSGWGPKTQKYGSDIVGRLGGEAAPMPREADTTTAAGRGMSAEDSIALVQRQLDKLPREGMDRAKAAALEELNPEKIEKDRKYDMYSALTSFGLNIMSPDNYQGEGILGSIAKAAKTTLPQYEASKKERKAAKSAAVRELMALEDVDRKTAVTAVEVGMDVYKTGLSADNANRALGFNYAQLEQQASEGKLNREADLLAAKLRASNPDKFDRIIGAVLAANPGMSELEAMQQAQKLNLLGGSQSGMEGLPGVTPQTGGAGGQQPVLLGSKPA